MLSVLTVFVLELELELLVVPLTFDETFVPTSEIYRCVPPTLSDAVEPETNVICGLLIVCTRPLVARKDATELDEIIPEVTAPKLMLPVDEAADERLLAIDKSRLGILLIWNELQLIPSEFSRLSVTSQMYI